MNRRLATLLICVAVTSSATCPAHAAPRPCSSSGSKTITTSTGGRVFTKIKGTADGRRNYVYACLYREGKTRRLGVYGASGGARNFVVGQSVRLNGRFATFLELTRPIASSTSNTGLIETDLRSGRRVFDSGGARAPDAGDRPGNRIYARVAKANGSLAFVLSEPGGIETVRRFDASGYSVIDTGAINELVMTLGEGRRTVHWQRGDGERRSAPIR